MKMSLSIFSVMTLLMIFVASNTVTAAPQSSGDSKSVVYSTDFETFSVGGQVACQDSENWTTWSDTPCTGEDAYISDDFAFSGSNSAVVENSNDMLLLLGDRTTGSYELSWWMYIETGKAGYYNMQHFENPGQEFAFEIYFLENGTGEFTTQAAPAIVFDYPKDNWFQVKHVVDIDNDLITLTINDNEVNSWPLSAVTNSTTPGTKQLGAIDFFAGATGSEVPKYYFDDVMFSEMLPPVYSTDFESFTVGGQIACQDTENWTTWSNAPCGAEDGYISSDFANSGSNSAKIENSNDLLLLLGDKKSGYYELSWWMYIETGKAGYYNMQHFENPGQEFAFEIYFLENGTGEFTTQAAPAIVFDYPKDSWFQVKHLVDIDNDLITLSIDNVQINSWPLSAVTNSTSPGTTQLGSIDFFAGATGSETPKYFFDDVMFRDAPPASPIDLSLQAILTPVSGPNLTDAEVVTIVVKNVGTLEQSDIPVSYTIDGGTPVNEIIPQKLAPGASVEYVFAQTADLSATQTYNFTASVSMTGDENPDNNSKNKTVENEGNVILMQEGSIYACEGTFYDTGGPEDDYSSSENLVLTILPSTPGARVIATFTQFSTEANYDFLKIYDGDNTDAEMLGSFSGTQDIGEFIASYANATGALTFQFTSDGSVQATGWVATLSCDPPKNHDLAAQEVTGPANPEVNGTYDYSVIISNYGLNDEAGTAYSVSLYDDNNTLIGTADGVDIPAGESRTLVMQWTPQLDGPAYLYGVVSLVGDENENNNTTPDFNVYVQPQGQAELIVGTGTDLASNVPVYPWYGYSFTQTIYLQSELNIDNKRIFRIGYQYGGSTTGLEFDIEIWLTHTSLTELTSTVPLSSFTKVYDGPYVVSAGEEYSVVDIDAFYYNNTDNLLVTIIEKKPGYSSSADKFYATPAPVPETMCRGAWNDQTPYDPNALPTGNAISVRANTKFWLGDVPTEPEVKVNPSSLYFGEVEATQTEVMTVEVMNSGGGTLVIEGADIANPVFTIPDAEFPINLSIGDKHFFDVEFAPVDPGLEEAVLTFLIDESVPGFKTVDLSGRGLRYGVLREGFEGELFPPLGWKIIDNNNDGKGWLRNTGFAPTGQTAPHTGIACASLDVYAGSPGQTSYDDWLITPRMIWQDGDVFKFFIKRLANQSGQTWRVCLSTTGTDVSDFAPIDEITDPSLSYNEMMYDLSNYGLFDGDPFYMAFQFNSLWCWPGVIDDVLGSVLDRYENDLMVLDLTGDNLIYVNTTENFELSFANYGQNDVNEGDYELQICAYIDGAETVLSSVPGIALAAGQTATVDLPLNLSDVGVYEIYAKIVWPYDMDITNNFSDIINLEVIPLSVNIINIGDFPIGSETDYYHNLPINLEDYFRTASLTECIYFKNEINTGGIIEKISYYRNFSEDMNQIPLTIWMGESGITSMTGNYIPPSKLTLVFDGKVDFAEGIGRADIELTHPFVYTGSGNLVVNVFYHDGPGYSDNAKFAYSDGGYIRSMYETGWSTIDPENITYSGTTTNYPSTSLRLETGNGLGQISGYVYYEEDSSPVDSAKVEVFNPDFPDVSGVVYSNSQGYYVIPYAMAGNNLTVTVSKFGYMDEVYENVNLPANGSVNLGNAYLGERAKITLSGNIITSDTQEPARFATVKLSGLEDYETTADVAGQFSFEEIWGATTYQIEVSYLDYQTYLADIDVPNTDYVLDPITVLENAPAPNLVNATEEDNDALITWYAAGQPYPMEFRYDDGNVAGRLITPGTPTLFTGALWNYDAILHSVSWYSFPSESYPASPEVRIIVLGVTDNGAPDETNQLALFENIQEVEGWNSYELPAPVDAPDGFFVGVAGYTDYSVLGYDDGVGEPYEWIPRTQWGNGLGAYTPLENGTSPPLHSSVMMRAAGLVYGESVKSMAPVANATIAFDATEDQLSICEAVEPFDAGDPKISLPWIPADAPKSFMHYNVYFKGADDVDWTQVNTGPVTDTSYLDDQWSTLNFGLYRYGVEAEYTNGVKSTLAESNIIEKDMRMDLTLTVNTNTGIPGMSEGASVILSNQNGNINYVYNAEVGPGGSVLIPQVMKGMYDLEVFLGGFDDYLEQNIDLLIPENTFEKEITLIESLNDPYDLEASTEGQLAGTVAFKWNQSPVLDNVDSYDPFLISGIGDWTMIDQDNQPTVTISGVNFPHTGEPFAFITMNRALTTPPLSEAYWGAHSGSQYFAAFGSAQGNTSNWMISPEQNHSLPYTLSFWAKSVNDSYGAETFRIAYSSGGNTLSDFINITGNVSTQTYWTKFSYTIPAEAKYVAIRHNHTGFALLIDDITLGVEADNSIPGNGFTVYLDDEVVETNVMANDYTFTGVASGTHTAGVQAQFYTGVSNISEVGFSVPESNMLTFNVEDDKGVPIDGATVNLMYNGSQIFTGLTENGLLNCQVYPGIYTWEASFGELASASGEIAVSGENTEVLVVLNHYYDLSIVVKDEQNKVVTDALVTFNFETLTTPINGTVSFVTEPGVYPYAVTHALYGAVTGMMEVTDDQTEVVILSGFNCLPPVDLAYDQYYNNIQLTWQPPDAINTGDWLHWDGENTGNSVGTGGAVDFDVAQRFEPSDLTPYDGKFLTHVLFIPREEQCTYSVRVWTGGNISAPEMLVVDQLVTNPLIDQWNEIVLEIPVYVDASRELWIGVRNNTTTGHPAGCDIGPAVNGKGNMINLAGQGWQTLLEAAPTLDFNWNVRGLLEDPQNGMTKNLVPLTDPDRGEFTGKLDVVTGLFDDFEEPLQLTGFNLYRNDVKLNTELLSGTSFDDNELPLGNYTYNVTAVYNNGCESGYSNSADVIVDELLGQIIQIDEGWSIISSYQVPDYPQLEDLFVHQIEDETIRIMIGKTGIFWPGQNINLIGEWNPYEAYKVRMNVADELNVQGVMLEDRTVNLTEGFNFMPVISDVPVEASEIFNQLGDKLQYAFDLTYNQVYWPEGGLYTLETLLPGKGYFVSLYDDGQVVFPGNGAKFSGVFPQKQVINDAPWAIERTGFTHIISITGDALQDLNAGDIIGVFNNAGRCVGMSVCQETHQNLALIVYGDDMTTAVIDGMLESEPMSFRIFNSQTRLESSVEVDWNSHMPNAGNFVENGLSSIRSFKLEALGLGNENSSKIDFYPNPAGDVIYFSGNTDQGIDVVIVDQMGKAVHGRYVPDGNKLDISTLQPGVYFLKITTAEGPTILRKLVVQ